MVLGDHFAIVGELEKIAASGRYSRLVEIGCGNGRVLHYLAQNLKGVGRFVGLDVNRAVICKNRALYADLVNMEFVCGDATAWMVENAAPGTICMVYGGVFEYFSQMDLERLLRCMAEHSPIAVALVEPITHDYDPACETVSRCYGAERSFSHNHRHLLEEAGFTIRFADEKNMNFRWMLMTAEV